MGGSSQDESPNAKQRWKQVLERTVKTVAAERRRQSAGDRLESLADVVQAMAAFDRDGRIRLNFAEDDERYDISAMRKQAHESESAATKFAAHETIDDDGRRVPALCICIMIVGTRGDVQPFLGIAKRLQEHGHRVRLATHAVYRDFVMEHDVEFYPLGGDPKELAAYMVKTGGHLIPSKLETIQKDVPRNLQMIDEILLSTWPAVSARDPDGGGAKGVPGKPFRANAIISNPVTYGHVHVAERLGVPLHIMFPQPWVPTTQFPHPLSNLPYTWKPQRRNYLSYKLVDLLMWQGVEGIINEFRTEMLGLSKIRKGDGGHDILLDLGIPHTFMWSKHLVPKPDDWGQIYDVIGTVTLPGTGASYTPSAELEEFLGVDGGPIFVGFGSMVLENPEATTKMIIAAAEQAKVRVLIQSSWSDMVGAIEVPENVFFLGNCPHEWLMPRVSAVVHHGGAGTTAAGLLAGKPTFIVPFFGDQHFWGRAVVVAGVGVEPCPIEKLSTEKLRVAFEAMQDPAIHQRAEAISELMKREDGVANAVECFYRNLPLKHMRCDLGCGRVATKWNQKDRLKLCAQCEFVVSSRPENAPEDIVEYHSVDYSARGPNSTIEGASAGAGAFLHELGSGVKDLFIKPAEGYREEGTKGAVIGLVKGIGGLLISPVQGAAQFADHIATGHHNETRGSEERKKGTVLFESKQIRDAVGLKSAPDAHSAAMSPDEAVWVDKKTTNRQVAVNLTADAKKKMETRFRDIVAQKKADNQEPAFKLVKGTDPSISDDGSAGIAVYSAQVPPTTSLRPPAMNVCMATTGLWEESVHQFVAIGQRLKADGHRVRVATNVKLRQRVIDAGLEFYPLGGRALTSTRFLEYVHEKLADVQRHRSNFMKFAASKFSELCDSFNEEDELRELVFSLWPACVEADPLVPGRGFRADAIISHPCVFGLDIVADRLGVPLHIMSGSPRSVTEAFPVALSAGAKLSKPYHYSRSSAASYQEERDIMWPTLKHILDNFRHSLGLTGKSIEENLLWKWQIPHTYLWNEALLPKPSDWGREVTIAGYVHFDYEDASDSDSTARQQLEAFVSANDQPVIYLGLMNGNLTRPHSILTMVAAIVQNAAVEAGVRVIVQHFNHSHPSPARVFGASAVLEVDPSLPLKLILPHVRAAIHWGDLFITSACATAGKPATVVPGNATQRLWGQALATARAGLEPIEVSAMSASALAQALEALLDAKLVAAAVQLAQTFDPARAVDSAVCAFYRNLPLIGMTCDLDPTRIARVYDPVHGLKLSYEAQLVVQQEAGGDDQMLKYKPLQYSTRHPPRLTLRHLTSHVLSQFTEANQRPSNAPVKRMESHAAVVVESPKFWRSPEERSRCEKEINAAYQSALNARAARRHSVQ